jgi:hypothetical protein
MSCISPRAPTRLTAIDLEALLRTPARDRVKRSVMRPAVKFGKLAAKPDRKVGHVVAHGDDQQRAGETG